MIEYEIENTRNKLLEPYIENYVKVKVNCNTINGKELFPRPGASWLLMNQPFTVDNKKFHSNCLVGIQVKSAHLLWNSDYLEGLSVKFTPFGLSRFVNTSISTLQNNVVDFQKLTNSNKCINHLSTSILEASSLTEKIALVESLLVYSFKEITTIESRIFHFANRIKSNPSININDAKKNVPLSSRQLERKFKELLGVNIQTFIRVCRFDQAKNQLLLSRKSKLTSLGYDLGYFDQSHFSKEFKRFSLVSPKKFPESHPFYNLIAGKY